MRGSPQISDAELALKVAQGDREAFAALYDRYAARVFGLCRRILGHSGSAEEATQETFLKLWARARQFNPRRGSLLGWLLTVARRTAIDRMRLESRRPPLAFSFNGEDLLSGLADPDSQGEEARWGSVRMALLELPPGQRQVIELAYYFDMTQSQIADHLGAPLGTVKTRMRLGMEKLRQALQAGDPEPSQIQSRGKERSST